MSPVFSRLHSKRFLMRAAARLLLCMKIDFIDKLECKQNCLCLFFSMSAQRTKCSHNEQIETV